MKIVKLILGTLAAIGTINILIHLVQDVGSKEGTEWGTSLFAGIAVLGICVVVTIGLFQSALQKPNETEDPAEHTEDASDQP